VAGDVYSLGVILYELLAGKRPYQVTTGSVVEWARAVCEQEPVPLSRAADGPVARRLLRGDLENITAKALAKDAVQRYASVEELAADVRRHLDGRPVKARRATLRYRAAKLAGRHRVAVPATALALALIACFAGAARWQAQRAERRFQDVRSLAHAVLFDLHDAIAKLPGSTAARELLVQRAMQYLEGLQREAGGNKELAREVALGYERVANVQGSLGEANLGKVPAALTNYEKANAILERLVKESPWDAGIRHDYSRVANGLVLSYEAAGKFDIAASAAKRNIALMETALRAHTDAVSLEDLAAAEAVLGSLLADQQQYAQAIPARQREVELARAAAILRPGDIEAQRSIAIAEKRLGALYGMEKRYGEGRQAYQQALAIDEQRVKANPLDMRAKMDLSYDYSDLGWIAGRMGDQEAALAAYRRTLAMRMAVAAADPNDFRAATAVASATSKIGVELEKQKKFAEAQPELRRATVLYEELARRPGALWTVLRDLAEVHVDNAEVIVALGRPNWRTLAAAEYAAARRLYEGLRDRGALPKTSLGRIGELAALERGL